MPSVQAQPETSSVNHNAGVHINERLTLYGKSLFSRILELREIFSANIFGLAMVRSCFGSLTPRLPNVLSLSWNSMNTWYLIVPFRTFLVCFGGILGEFGRAIVRILARSSRAKIPMARLNEPGMPPKRTKKVRLDIYRTQIQAKI